MIVTRLPRDDAEAQEQSRRMWTKGRRAMGTVFAARDRNGFVKASNDHPHDCLRTTSNRLRDYE